MSFERTLETISTPGADIDVFVVRWDTAIFGFPVAQLDRIELRHGGDPSECVRRLQSWMDHNGIRLASCRLDSRALRESMLLEECGFRFVEMVYSPILEPVPAISAAEQELVVEPAGAADLPAIEAIASTAFDTGRFRLDWRIDPTANGRRYCAWVRNSFADPRQRVLKATLAGVIAGFFIVEDQADRGVYWHLTAIAPAWQGRGIGRRLWREMVRLHYDSGANKIATTISAHNWPVMNIYAALGFRFGSPRMTLHWVRE